MCPDANNSDDSEDDENGEEVADEAEREEEDVDPDESDDDEEEADHQEDDEDTDDNEEMNRPTTPFGLGSVVRDMQAALDALDSINIYEMIDPEVLRILNDPDFRRILAQPAIDRADSPDPTAGDRPGAASVDTATRHRSGGDTQSLPAGDRSGIDRDSADTE